LFINDRPTIITPVNIRDGYMARSLCLVDGFPADITLRVDTRTPSFSTYSINVFDAAHGQWIECLYTLDSEEVGDMPVFPEDGLPKLQQLAELLWNAANAIMITARMRQDDLDVGIHARETSVSLQVREEARVQAEEAEEARIRAAERAWAQEHRQGEYAVHDLNPYDGDAEGHIFIPDSVTLPSDIQLAEIRKKFEGESTEEQEVQQ
jgi:hypothetical protein